MTQDDAYGATVAKRRLSRRLYELRVQAGYTANQVCDRLAWGRGKVGRFEANDWVRPGLSDIRDLARVYGVTDDELAELERLAIVARKRPWWRDYPEVFGGTEFCGFEADATTIRVLMPLILPGLLQTPAYIKALMAVGSRPPEWQEQALEARLRRQRILDRPRYAPKLVAVITEAALSYRWGTPEERRAQIEHLADMSRRPSVEIRLLTFDGGLHPAMNTLVNIFQFPGNDPAVVFLENDAAIEQIDDLEQVEAHEQIFHQACAAALKPAATTAYLDKLKDTLE